MRTPADVRAKAQVGALLVLRFCEHVNRELGKPRAVIEVCSDGVVLEGGATIKWANMIVQDNGFTIMLNGRIHLQYEFHREAVKDTKGNGTRTGVGA